MSAASNPPANATTQAGLSSPCPPATRQGAGGFQNILGLPVQYVEDWLVFDCRSPEDGVFSVKAPWGETLIGAEQAAYSMGLRTSWMGNDTTPAGLSGCQDLRQSQSQFERVARDLVQQAKRLMKDYEAAKRNPAPEGAGGSVYYRPVAIAISNFGGSVLADRRDFSVRCFSN